MPFPADSILNAGSDRFGGKKSSDACHEKGNVKKSKSSSKHAETDATAIVASSNVNHGKTTKKTGIPRVKPLKPIPDNEKWAAEKKRSHDEKRTASEEKHEDKGKRAGSVIFDKQPNKKAQRAKGSTAISKLSTPVVPKSRPTSSVDRLSRPSTREEESKGEGQNRELKVKPTKGKLKEIDSKEENRSLSSARKATWLPEKSEGHIFEEKKKVVETMPKPPKISPQEETQRTQNLIQGSELIIPNSTCSFFEKLQQGVRAYFLSRSSVRAVTSDEPTKAKLTEGGTCVVGVASEVKEEPREEKAKVLGNEKVARIKLLNPNNNNKKDSKKNLKKLPRLGVRGQKLVIFDARLNIDRQFRVMKRRKLYHPKKHYVRIQIPRKGYFYRSFVQPKVTWESSFLPTRMEPKSIQKIHAEQKIQISGLAATSAKISGFCEKGLKITKKRGKRLNKCRNKTKPYNCTSSISDQLVKTELVSFSGSHIIDKTINSTHASQHLDVFGCLNNNGLVSLQFDQGKDNERSLDWPQNSSHTPDREVTLLQDGNIIPYLAIANSHSEDKIEERMESEKLNSEASGKSKRVENLNKSRKRRKKLSYSSGDESDMSEVETSGDGLLTELGCSDQFDMSELNYKKKFPGISNSNRMVVANGQVLQEKLTQEPKVSKIRDSVHITSVQPEKSISSRLIKSSNSTKNITSVMLGCLAKEKDKSCEPDLKHETSFSSLFRGRIEYHDMDMHRVQDGLMEDIDLHMELENYLKASNTFNNIVNEVENDMLYILGNTPQNEDDKIDNLKLKVKSDKDLFKKLEEKNICDRHSEQSIGKSSLVLEYNLQSKDLSLKCNQHSNTKSDIDTSEKMQPNDLVLQKPKHPKSSSFENNSEPSSRVSSKNSIRAIVSNPFVSHIEDKFRDEAMNDNFSSKTTFFCDSNRKKNVELRTSLEQLTEIYNSILKEYNNKLRDRKKSVKLVRTNLLSFLDNLLSLKLNKSGTKRIPEIKNTNLTQPTFKYTNHRACKTENDNFITLEEYVNMVQEMLSSTLSIEQISILNDITAKLRQKSKNTEICETKNKKTKKWRDLVLKEKCKGAQVKRKETVENKKQLELKNEGLINGNTLSTNDKSARKQKSTPHKRKFSGGKKEKQNDDQPLIGDSCDAADNDITKIYQSNLKLDLSSPNVLHSILKSQFMKSNADIGKDDTDTEVSDIQKKLLVSVQLSGEEVLVDGITHINNENNLEVPRLNGKTDLIIENVKNEILNEFYQSNAINTTTKNSNKNIRKLNFGQEKLKIKKGVKKYNFKKSRALDISNERMKLTKPVEGNDGKRTKKLTIETKNGSKTENVNNYFVEMIVPTYKKSFSALGRKEFHDYPYEYDQQKLKAQHPIEAIVESSESKLDEFTNENLGIEKQGNIRDTLCFNEKRGTLKRKISIDLMKYHHLKQTTSVSVLTKDVDFSNPADDICGKVLELTESQIIRNDTKAKFNEKSQQRKPKTVDDTSCNESPVKIDLIHKSIRRNLRSMNVFCYPLTQNLNSKKKNKSLKGSDEIANDIRQNFLSKFSRSQSRTEKRNKSESTSWRTCLSSLNTLSKGNTSLDTPSKTDISSRQSIQFLYTDSSEKSLSISSDFEEPVKPPFHRSYDPSLHDLRPMSGPELQKQFNSAHSFYGTKSSMISFGKGGNDRDLPVYIHHPRNESNEISFPSLMIHSDSLLKSRSTFGLTKSKLISLLKSKSDMKFFPGRINENCEEQPLIKFVLTPKQKAVAGVPSGQVIVISQNVVEEPYNKKKEPQMKNKEESKTKVSLRSIEDFIETLSHSVIRPNKKKLKNSKGGHTKFEGPKPLKKLLINRKRTHVADKKSVTTSGEHQIRNVSSTYNNGKKRQISDKRNLVPKRMCITDQKALKTTTRQKKITLTDLKNVKVTKVNVHLMSNGKTEINQPIKEIEKNNEAPAIYETRELDEKPNSLAVKVDDCHELKKCTPDVLKVISDILALVASFEDKTDVLHVLNEYAKSLKTDKVSKSTETENMAVRTESTTESLNDQEIQNKMKLSDTDINYSQKRESFRTIVHFSLCPMEQELVELKKTKEVTVTKDNTRHYQNEIQGQRDLSKRDDTYSHGIETAVLTQAPSTYFDAEDFEIESGEEENFREIRQLLVRNDIHVSQYTVPESMIHKEDQITEKDLDFFPNTVALTVSDTLLLHQRNQLRETDNKIFDKVLLNVGQGNVNYVFKLLQAFFETYSEQKTVSSVQWSRLRQKLFKLLEDKNSGREEKNENKEWLQILSHLNKVSYNFSVSSEDSKTVDYHQTLRESPLEPAISNQLLNLEKGVCKAMILQNAFQCLDDKNFIDNVNSEKEPYGLGNKIVEWKTWLEKNQIDLVNLKLFTTIGDSFRFIKHKIASELSMNLH